jgi:membrane-bound serine protease (ClpP class)
MDAATASTFLYICGGLLLIAEVAVVSFGVLALNGLIALFAAYAIQTGDNLVLGVPIDWSFLFGIAFIEGLIIVAGIYIILKHRNKKPTTGSEGLIGEKAVVVEWDGKEGRVRIQGEIWAAQSNKPLQLSEKDKVTVTKMETLILTIEA